VSESTYTVRYWGGPKDGAEEQITCGYPPKTLNGYGLAYSKVGRFYQYSWARRTREKQGGDR
jgi:hypothetical protein